MIGGIFPDIQKFGEKMKEHSLSVVRNDSTSRGEYLNLTTKVLWDLGFTKSEIDQVFEGADVGRDQILSALKWVIELIDTKPYSEKEYSEFLSVVFSGIASMQGFREDKIVNILSHSNISLSAHVLVPHIHLVVLYAHQFVKVWFKTVH